MVRDKKETWSRGAMHRFVVFHFEVVRAGVFVSSTLWLGHFWFCVSILSRITVSGYYNRIHDQ